LQRFPDATPACCDDCNVRAIASTNLATRARPAIFFAVKENSRQFNTFG